MKTTIIKAAKAATLIRAYGVDNPVVHLQLDHNPIRFTGPDGMHFYVKHEQEIELSDQGICNTLTVTGYGINLQFIVVRGVKQKDIERIEAGESGQLYADW